MAASLLLSSGSAPTDSRMMRLTTGKGHRDLARPSEAECPHTA
jgi:hypothetical protein